MSDCRHNAPDRGPNPGDVQTQWQQPDQPNSEELLDQLAECLFRPDSDADIASIDRCLEELEQNGAPAEFFDVEQSLQDFHERYAPAFEPAPGTSKENRSRVRRPLARIAIIAVALCAFMLTAQASGFDLLSAIARWTSEHFSFVKIDDERQSAPGVYSDSLKSALQEYYVEETLAPTQFPEGTVLSGLVVKGEKDTLAFSAKYSLRETHFYISVCKAVEIPYSNIEINDSSAESYWVREIEHHIMADVKQIKAIWNNGPWECYIAGDLTREELLLMIDSIYN